MNFNNIKIEDKTINNLITNLKQNGINASVVNTGEEAKKTALKLIPKGSEVMTATSTTLDQLGLTEILNNSADYISTKNELKDLDREKDHRLMQRIGAAPEFIVGSVHAVTREGHIYIASNTGSQLPSYSYGADHVIWIVSTKKIVDNDQQALERIYDFVLPLESERAKKAYGVDGSFVSKILIVNREVNPKRINLIFVKEDYGF